MLGVEEDIMHVIWKHVWDVQTAPTSYCGLWRKLEAVAGRCGWLG